MNLGTIVRTTFTIATCLNTALMSINVIQFENATVDLIYKICSVLLNFVIVACATYFNNDYTPEAAEATGMMRQMKAEKKEGYIGEVFHDEKDDLQTDEQQVG